MKIVILNGSPKGNELSVTMQYIFYIEKIFTEHEFTSINVGQLLTNMRIRDGTFQKILEEIKSSDGIVWAFPVYTSLIPSQLKKFIELLFERNVEELKEKYAVVISTSMNFYDNAAHDYMHAVVEDLGMKYVGFFSAELSDFMKFDFRKKWYIFMENFFNTIVSKEVISSRFAPIKSRTFEYIPKSVANDMKIDNLGKRIIIFTDFTDIESNAARMVNRFKDSFKQGVEIYNFHDIDIKGGCLGCCECGLDNQCVYKDGFSEFFQKNKNSDILVYSGTMTDRFLSSKWKQYLDRCFHNGHIPGMEGTQMCFLISGELSQNENLRQWISAFTELSFGNLVDVVTDEYGESEEIDELIYNMAKQSIEFSKKGYVRPPTFLHVGGYKIFRDMIYGVPGALFRMDYKFFKKRKMFDFPTRNWRERIRRGLFSTLFKSKKVRNKFKPKMKEALVNSSRRELKKINFELEKENLKDF
jgi:multimeric flavodoxin WrbA